MNKTTFSQIAIGDTFTVIEWDGYTMEFTKNSETTAVNSEGIVTDFSQGYEVFIK